MMRKVMIILLSGAICLLSVTPLLAQPFTPEGRWATPQEYEKATGKTIEKFHEAPMLRTLVAAGEIPSVSERLPEEPLVIKPDESMGKYGGSLTLLQWSAGGWGGPPAFITFYENLIGRGEDARTLIPNIVKDWKLSPDAKSLTLYLRKAMKWSDGQPFTADDFLFWYNDILQNKELTPTLPKLWMPGGKLIELEKIDDYTVKFKSAIPWPGILYALADRTGIGCQHSTDGSGCFEAAHYLKKFHIKYNPDADKLAKEEGFDRWYQLFGAKLENNPELPTLGPWAGQLIAPDHVTLVRNPYYWKVDTEGNQLPYIDKVTGVLAEKKELRLAKILAGEPDFGSADIPEFPTIMQTADKNNYEATVEATTIYKRSLAVALFFNHTLEDSFLRELFSNVKFKQALSLAINRDEVNELVFLGLAEPTQATLPLPSPYYEERFGRAYAQYDPQRAKQLLDEIGLKTSKEGYRLRPDGKPLVLVIELAPWLPFHEPAAELIKDYWEKIGIKTSIDATGGGEMWTLYSANKSQISMWVIDESTYANTLIRSCWWATCQFWGRQWQLWFQTDGEKGEEPPEKVKEFVNVWRKIPHTISEEQRINMGKRALELLSENLWIIGVTTFPRGETVRFAHKSLGNVDIMKTAGEDYGYRGGFQWFWKK